MAIYQVMVLYDANEIVEVEAESDDEALDKAYDNATARLCHQCAHDLNFNDAIEACILQKDGEDYEYSDAVVARDTRQASVYLWAKKTFGEIAARLPERVSRLTEEVLEFAQACGIAKSDVLRLVDYVYARPVGDPRQEAGGVGLTLLAACECLGFSAEGAECAEWNRVQAIDVEVFRKKHNTKAAEGVATRTDAKE